MLKLENTTTIDSRTTALIGLDVDGVFNESYASILYGMPYDKRLAEIEAELYMYFSDTYGETLTLDNMLHRTGVMPISIRELDYTPMYMVLLAAHKTAQFILTSSWVFTKATPMSSMDTLEFVFQKVKPRDLPYFVASTTGCSGLARERAILETCTDLGWVGTLLAIDDSERMYMKIKQAGLLVSVDSPNGFSPLNLHEALLIQGNASESGRKIDQTKFPIFDGKEIVYEI